MGETWFVTGGARSGKSAFAAALAAETARPVTYLATLEPGDPEMVDRIARHRADRDPAWTTVEAPLAPAAAAAETDPAACLLLDCLSLWVSNALIAALPGDAPTPGDLAAIEGAVDAEVAALLAACDARDAPTVIVSNEVGSGLVPPYALGRAYRDLLGRANQAVSRHATRAWLVVAGRPIALPPHPQGGRGG